jgi:hypothetical protein
MQQHRTEKQKAATSVFFDRQHDPKVQMFRTAGTDSEHGQGSDREGASFDILTQDNYQRKHEKMRDY